MEAGALHSGRYRGRLTPRATGFSRRLTELRLSRDLSLWALSEASGVGMNTLASVERGERDPSFEVIRLVCRALSVGVIEFLAGVEDLDAPRGFYRYGTRAATPI